VGSTQEMADQMLGRWKEWGDGTSVQEGKQFGQKLIQEKFQFSEFIP
jgi:hypothetical protein